MASQMAMCHTAQQKVILCWLQRGPSDRRSASTETCTVPNMRSSCWIQSIRCFCESLEFCVGEDPTRERVQEREGGKLHNEIKGHSVCMTQFEEQWADVI